MDEHFRSLLIIWLALMGGVAAFTTVSFCLVVFGVMDVGMLPPPVLPIVAAAAAVLMAVGMVLRRRMVEAIPRGLGAEQRLARYQAAVIQGLALIEGAGLLVVTLGLLAAAPAWILAGGIAAVLVMTMARPTRNEVDPGGR